MAKRMLVPSVIAAVLMLVVAPSCDMSDETVTAEKAQACIADSLVGTWRGELPSGETVALTFTQKSAADRIYVSGCASAGFGLIGKAWACIDMASVPVSILIEPSAGERESGEVMVDVFRNCGISVRSPSNAHSLDLQLRDQKLSGTFGDSSFVAER